MASELPLSDCAASISKLGLSWSRLLVTDSCKRAAQGTRRPSRVATALKRCASSSESTLTWRTPSCAADSSASALLPFPFRMMLSAARPAFRANWNSCSALGVDHRAFVVQHAHDCLRVVRFHCVRDVAPRENPIEDIAKQGVVRPDCDGDVTHNGEPCASRRSCAATSVGLQTVVVVAGQLLAGAVASGSPIFRFPTLWPD